jgi:hypothetical protein
VRASTSTLFEDGVEKLSWKQILIIDIKHSHLLGQKFLLILPHHQ